MRALTSAEGPGFLNIIFLNPSITYFLLNLDLLDFLLDLEDELFLDFLELTDDFLDFLLDLLLEDFTDFVFFELFFDDYF